MSVAIDNEIQQALELLQRRIAARIREEQRRDQLTGLANGSALLETIGDRLGKPGEFWIAFIEIDRFKWINDRFGYENADALLRKVAEVLATGCSFFPGATQAFRAHGDEFYMMGEPATTGGLGEASPDLLGDRLDLIRRNIAAVNIVVERPATMSCTVSIGWLTISDIREARTDRRVLESLERAVSEAKMQGRDRVVRYSSSLAHQETISLRTDCAGCGCKISFELSRAKNRRDAKVSCPNCSAELERPPEPQPIQPVEVQIV